MTRIEGISCPECDHENLSVIPDDPEGDLGGGIIVYCDVCNRKFRIIIEEIKR